MFYKHQYSTSQFLQYHYETKVLYSCCMQESIFVDAGIFQLHNCSVTWEATFHL